jgi:hypothetical protein
MCFEERLDLVITDAFLKSMWQFGQRWVNKSYWRIRRVWLI